MALLMCPECQEKVSDRAAACPKCGCPISESPLRGQAHRPTPVRVTEVQFTRKWVKLLGVLSLVTFWGGFYLIDAQPFVAGLTIIAGAAGAVISSVAGWWLHA